MSKIDNIIISDGTGEQTFIPNTKDGNFVRWVISGTSTELDRDLTSNAPYSTTAANRRIRYVIKQPFVLTDVNGVKSYQKIYVNIDFNIPKVAPASEITKLRNLAAAALGNAIIVDQVDNGNNPY
jgi:hypothetical protein